jgi:hypothetical protein
VSTRERPRSFESAHQGQRAVNTLGRSARRLFWVQDEPTRRELLTAYLDVLDTFKLVADDLFAEAVFQTRPEPPPVPSAPPTPPAQAARAEALLAEQQRQAGTVYLDTLRTWARGSPLLEQNPAGEGLNLGNSPTRFIREPSNMLGVTLGRHWSTEDDPFWMYGPNGFTTFTKEVRKTTAAEIATMRRDPSITGFTRLAVHGLGMLFVRAQLELNGWTDGDDVERQDVAGWYSTTGRLVDTIRLDVLDVLGAPMRHAIVAGDTALAKRFEAAEATFHAELTRVYSVRRLETDVLHTYYVRTLTNRYESTADAIGVNGTVEEVNEYAGNANPDRKDLGNLLTVVGLINEAATRVDTTVSVTGVLKPGGRLLTAEAGKPSVELDLTTHGRRVLPLFTGKYNRVVATGTVAQMGKVVSLNDASIRPFAITFASKVGFPLRRSLAADGGDLELEPPSWRTRTPALEFESRAERQDRSLPGTLAGQQALVVAVLRQPDVVRRLGPRLARDARAAPDMSDPRVRTEVWRAVFAGLVRTAPRTAFADFLALLQDYLTSYTRHTMLNLRDGGRNYLDSPWPTDLTGSSFYDCGVYAIQNSRDIHAAVHGTSVNVELRFMTFLNHVCLVGYVDDQVFLTNNEKIVMPQPIGPAPGLSARERMDRAGLRLAQAAFANVYDVTFTIFPAVMPSFGVSTTLGEPAFRTKVWTVFHQSIGWGLHPATADEYFKAMRDFDIESKRLQAMLGQLDDPVIRAEATRAAVRLYSNAQKLADQREKPRQGQPIGPGFMFQDHPFPGATFFRAVGFGAVQRTPPRGAAGTSPARRPSRPAAASLPMWDLVVALRKRADLSTAERAFLDDPNTLVGEDHLVALNQARPPLRATP